MKPPAPNDTQAVLERIASALEDVQWTCVLTLILLVLHGCNS